eukprot:76856_1
MATFARNEAVEYIVYGYIQRIKHVLPNIKLFSIISKKITHIILQYYYYKSHDIRKMIPIFIYDETSLNEQIQLSKSGALKNNINIDLHREEQLKLIENKIDLHYPQNIWNEKRFIQEIIPNEKEINSLLTKTLNKFVKHNVNSTKTKILNEIQLRPPMVTIKTTFNLLLNEYPTKYINN